MNHANDVGALLRVYAGHDITIYPVLHALMPQGNIPWPGYASEVRLDLIDTPNGPQVFVYFNDKLMSTTIVIP